MKIDIITLFPTMFEKPFSESIIGRARKNKIVDITIWNLRDFSTNKHKTVDDYPFGGGGGMILAPEPFFRAVEHIKQVNRNLFLPRGKIILMSPQGERFNQKKAVELSHYDHLIILCGHYEGFDERIREYLAEEEISIGDYVLTGGELPAMVVVDSVVRLLPGVLGNSEATEEDSFSRGLLEYPQYTRPRDFRGYLVPDVLLSGNHKEIARWRREQSLLRTLKRRPEMLENCELTKEDIEFLKKLKIKGTASNNESRKKENI
ncbi:MAG TPA: tRNA (guanosine(37)-N1)-methyltransferase TrmD [Clostridia bacterium]|jgi:tRNA (guanine37-N1)-methyltransferase|nr:tRNA (guanosine(37)-N1)-methyltransferase TrmD [Clostridia bacterium]